MIEEILYRLRNNQSISNIEFILLCNHFNIKLGPRTKGFINSYITKIYIDKEDNLDSANDEITFTLMCTHEDSYNTEYELPNGIKALFCLFALKLTESE